MNRVRLRGAPCPSPLLSGQTRQSILPREQQDRCDSTCAALVSPTLRLIVAICVVLLLTAGLSRGQGPSKKMPALVIVARPFGFEPASLGHSAGKVLVIVNNQSGNPKLTMHLKSSSGVAVHDFPVFSGRHHWQELVTLTPGKFTLVEDGHNQWTSTITIK